MKSRTGGIGAWFGLLIGVSGWALAPIFIRLLSGNYEPITQSFLRYASATSVLLLISVLYYRPDLGRILRNPLPLLLVSGLNVALQCTWTLACYGDMPVTAITFLNKLNVVFVIFFSFIVFHEERNVILSVKYLSGTALSLTGVFFLLCSKPESFQPQLDLTTVYITATAILWGAYVVASRHVVLRVHPVPMFAVLALLTTVALGIIAFLFEQPAQALHVPIKMSLLCVISGMLAIGLTHPCYHFAQKHLGSAPCSSLALFNPFITYAVSVFILHEEVLEPKQWLGAVILIGGTLLVTVAMYRRRVVEVPVPTRYAEQPD